jgi:hypothetical protein
MSGSGPLNIAVAPGSRRRHASTPLAGVGLGGLGETDEDVVGWTPPLVATLGPDGTSSEQAAQFFFSRAVGRPAADGDLQLYRTYEEAEAAVLDGKATHLVVAAAYAGCNHFYMTNGLVPDHASNFAMDTPPYLLAARARMCLLPDAVRVATHPAPEEVIDELLSKMTDSFRWYKAIAADSTAEAARMVADGEVEVALTTDPACRRFNLTPISLSKVIPMFWLVFVKAA